VEVQGDTSVVALKEMVAAKAGMAVDACRVIFCGKVYHARVFEGVNENRPYPDTVSTLENHCLAGELNFGDPFQDSGVVAPHPGRIFSS